MSDQQFILLFNKHLEGDMSEQDRRTFQEMMQQDGYRQLFDRLLKELAETDHSAYAPAGVPNPDALFRRVINTDLPVKSNLPIRAWYAAAAVVLLLAGVATVYLMRPMQQQPAQVVAQNPPANLNTIGPGTTGAILTLADGRKIALDTLRNGTVATQQGAVVSLEKGQLNYAGVPYITETVGTNTLVTKKGRQFSVVLPDGTRAWLNAASSLTYPTAFIGNERRVQVTGEVYFDVAPNRNKPFYAVTGNYTTEVLGTAFNINSYDNEELVKITLLNGGVRVHAGEETAPQHKAVVLKPGEQWQITKSTGGASVKSIDPGQVTAWKDGYFYFKNAGIKTVMRELERWYDIQVVYEGEPTARSFEGKIQKDLSLPELLFGLGKTEIRCRMEGRKLIIEK